MILRRPDGFGDHDALEPLRYTLNALLRQRPRR